MPGVLSYGDEDGNNFDIDEENEGWSHIKRLDFYGQCKKLDDH